MGKSVVTRFHKSKSERVWRRRVCDALEVVGRVIGVFVNADGD